MNYVLLFQKIWALITTVFMGITALISPTPTSTATAQIVDERQYVLENAATAGQGLTTDGTYFYTSGSITAFKLTGLSKIDKATGEIIQSKFGALPYSFIQDDYDHIGAISVYNGKIYAPVEDKGEKEPLVLIYDAETLEYTGTYYKMQITEDNKPLLDDGIAWCTVDAENGYLYASQFHTADFILAYNLDDMSFSHKIILSQQIDRVQGCACIDGKIYANCDPKKENKTVYEIDCITGETKLLFDRNTTGIDCETEGIAVYKDENGELTFTICDYDKTVSLFVRTYKLK